MSDPNEKATHSLSAGLPSLRASTTARVALGRTGNAISMRDQLAFQLDHAFARDAVGMQLNTAWMLSAAQTRNYRSLLLESAAADASTLRGNRRTYLQRPDLGRRLNPGSAARLQATATELEQAPDVVFVIADGLSALAVERHGFALLDAVQPLLQRGHWRTGPLCVVREGRVAIADEIGEIFRAALVVILIGERPGLSSPDSLGVYITWDPKVGRTDAERNCISNIRQGGLTYAAAADRLIGIMSLARDLGGTGVKLTEGRSKLVSAP